MYCPITRTHTSISSHSDQCSSITHKNPLALGLMSLFPSALGAQAPGALAFEAQGRRAAGLTLASLVKIWQGRRAKVTLRHFEIKVVD